MGISLWRFVACLSALPIFAACGNAGNDLGLGKNVDSGAPSLGGGGSDSSDSADSADSDSADSDGGGGIGRDGGGGGDGGGFDGGGGIGHDGGGGGDGGGFDGGGGTGHDGVGGNGGGTVNPGTTVTLHGRVMSPSGAFPISGALVYLTQDALDVIPHGAYHYECDEMEGTRYTLSTPDGGWSIEGVPVGKWTIVTRKGNFRRAREINVTQDMESSIPIELTSLPRARTSDNLDVAPSFAVVRTSPDLTHNLLAKFGMGDVAADGSLINGTQTFDIYDDSSGSNPHTRVLFDEDRLQNYHMIFLPCNANSVGVQFVNNNVQKLRNYVSMGGRIHNSCTVSLWTKAPFPKYIEFYGNNDTTKFDIGRISNNGYTTNGLVLDEGLGLWLPLVTGVDPSSVPFHNMFVNIAGTVNDGDGHGLEKDDGIVMPYTWVQDAQRYAGSPLMVTYNFDFGKVFYSVCETSTNNANLTHQEYVLLYIILEVGVCDNLPALAPSLDAL